MKTQLKVVIADNSAETLSILKDECEQKGMDVSVAENGAEALELIQKNNPDVVVIDSLLPMGDGLWVLNQLQSTNYDMKKIIFTSYATEIVIQKTMSMGIGFLILKPFSAENILERIADVGHFSNMESTETDEEVKVIKKPKKTRVSKKQEKVETYATEALRKFGIRTNLNGHDYLVYCIKRTIEDRSALRKVTSGLYVEAAAQFGTSASGFERSIRHAIEGGWSVTPEKVKNEYFGVSNSGENTKRKPSNVSFIGAIATKIQSQYNLF